jgi:nitrate/TMAO reductase-like tetraheme cytochrome c subunit
MDAMKLLGTDAVGVGDRDLRYGIAFLKSQAKRSALPLVCANLLDKRTQAPVFSPHLVKKVGTVKVGIFGLISDKADLGPARDSLIVKDPLEASTKAVAALRKSGATVIVLLSQLGKVESEDLVAANPGIDAIMVGRNTPLIQKGRIVKNAVACYGGEQGQYLCRTSLTLTAQRRSASGESDAFMLGPEVGEKREVLELVKSFEDEHNERLRREEKERAAQGATQVESAPEHFLGAELCIRCHTDEAEQWKTTSHSIAWKTLVDAKKDATPECITCHVVGFKQPGGFVSAATTPKLSNVQCENCHGMGTQHEAFANAPSRVTEQTCITCHHGENDPEWNFEKKLPKIAHNNRSGETIQNKKNKMGGSPSMMKGH